MGALTLKGIGRPTSLVVTGASQKTITDIHGWKPVGSLEIVKHMSWNKRVPLNLQGDEMRGIEIVTSDMSAAIALKKGQYCTGLTFTAACVKAADSSTTQPTEVYTLTIDKCTQENDLVPEAAGGGKAATITLRFIVCQDPATGTEGAFAETFA